MILWTDDDGVVHTIIQAEGGEQGCPLMLALYAFAQYNALVSANGNLLPTEHIFSLLADLYVVTCRSRARDDVMLGWYGVPFVMPTHL